MRVLIFVILFLNATSVSNASQNYIFEVMRCDKAMEMILDSRSADPVFLNPSEIAEVDGFLLAFGFLTAHETPKASKAARGAAIGSLLFFCENAPSRTIVELIQKYYRR